MNTSDLFSVDNKVALVTGAGGGLGGVFAAVLAEHGARVVCVGRNLDKLEAVVERIRREGRQAIAVSADVGNRESLEKAFDSAESAYGVADILVNCAGIQSMAPVLEMQDEQFTSVMETNVNGLWRAAQICAQRLRKADKDGSIVNIASILGTMARPTFSNYCASKAAVIHMSRSMALDLIPYGIRVNTLAPGYIETDLTRWFLASPEGKAAMARLPIGRFGLLEELAGPLLLLASDASSYMAGSVVTVDAAHSVSILE